MRRMHSKLAILAGLIGIWLPDAHADAVLRSTDAAYPARLLRHTVTEVSVDIHGLVAETRAYSEFKNDWDRATDGVYSFPLPAGAYATRLSYALGETVIDAALKEIPQTNLPGTGEGGFAAELNRYLGKNKVTLQVPGIPAGGTAKIELRFVQKLELEAGRITFTYPLATQPFLTDALGSLSLSVKVWKPWTVSSWSSLSHPRGWIVAQNDATVLSVKRDEAKAFPEGDFEWGYSPGAADFSGLFQSAKPGDSAGFLLASVIPPLPAPAIAKPRSVLFLLDKSRSMSRSKVQQAADAVKACLRSLAPGDRFALAASDYNLFLLAPFQEPSDAAKAVAASILDSLSGSAGASASNLTNALNSALRSFPAGADNPQVFLFSDGQSDFAPGGVANPAGAPVFALGLGRDANRARLEAAGGIGDGLTAYFREDEAVAERASAFFQAVSAPALAGAGIAGAAGRLSESILVPGARALWNWGGLALAARYAKPGAADFALTGTAGGTPVSRTLQATLAADSSQTGGTLSMRFWAAERIRALENQIDLKGFNTAARLEAIRLSLQYKVKCRYTSYQSETEPVTTVPGDMPTLVARPGADAKSPALKLERAWEGRDLAIRIGFPGLAGGKDAWLEIYDARGNLIRRMRAVEGAPGFARFRWDGRNRNGALAREGLLLVFRAGDRVLAREFLFALR